MTQLQPLSEPGRFQWNAGAWFGTQVGGTVWILGAAFTLLKDQAGPGIVAFLAFLAPNVFGFILYRMRNRIASYPALQGMVGFAGAVSVSFVVYLNQAGVVDKVDPQLEYGQCGFYLLPVMFGGLMLIFHWMQRKAVQKHRTGRQG